MDFVCSYESPLGGMTLASDGEALTGLRFDGQRYYDTDISAACCEKALPVFDETRAWLDAYFSGSIPGFIPRLSLRGTPFQLAVWTLLLAVPYGETRAYGELAAELAAQRGRRVSAQAVGGAVSRNPVALIVPCHRIIGANHALTGYAGGLDKKRALLALECGSRMEP